MTTTSIRPGLAAATDDWLAKKLMQAGFGGPDCNYPDYTVARAPARRASTARHRGSASGTTSPRDRQVVYRARKALEKERAAAPEPVPVQQAVAQGAREQQVLAPLPPEG
ncbi:MULTISPECIES: hypothetical protein [Streptomyces]|uniref:Uncharacterized protein n=1 Tax=Streptomyces canarius TaxID=285453 RepID=A0ABQ3D1N0_9ACTN|nr:hypothetical protein [Streptomyces canarius]GHA51592.1 hypothetical protein GCM10010345_65160 [Streptomyces canarius]